MLLRIVITCVTQTAYSEVDDMKKYIRASRSNAFVGIWWYTDDGRVIGSMCPVEIGYLDGILIQYSRTLNHRNTWKSIVYHKFEGEEADKIYNLGYRGLERGRVVYNTLTQVYIITCSETMCNNKEALSKIKDTFSLSGNRCEVEVLDHYSKLPLTGNPAVDDSILNLDF